MPVPDQSSLATLARDALWIALPVTLAGIAHMAVVKKDLLPAWKVPLDGGRTFRGERIFGDNKTWRGAVFMVAGPALLGLAQGALAGDPLGYALMNVVLGVGYVLGELPNSFAKRRLAITPGKTGAGAAGALFFLLDQADSVIAALGLGALVYGWGWRFVLVGTALLTGLHLALNAGMYAARLRKNL